MSGSPSTSAPPHYAMVIEWSDDDQAFVVSFPEWDATGMYFVHTHGDTYEQAVKNGQDVLSDLVALAQERGEPLPEPRRYAAAEA